MTVASRFYPFNLVLPAGVLVTAPVTTKVPLEDILLRRVDVRIPPGPRGSVGFYILLQGTPIVPWGNPPVWIIGDDEPLSFPVNTEDNGGVSIVAFNIGAFVHTLYFRFLGTPMGLVPAATPIVTIADLN